MFRKILIANRGEIACRIIRTARRMGLATVAVYSEADTNSRHVRMADEGVGIGPAPARESYLNAERILTAATQTGAEAIHPGYGFLSENADFAEACVAAGIVFIGPPPAAIRAMGLKSAAKTLMEKAGVPLTPGYHGDNQEPAFLAKQAANIGYPVLIKASAGGGGKGMRRVDAAKDFAAALASCRREAASAFGDDRVLVEKYVLKPRHIEIQVFADTLGTCIHLFERDCSVQRRHQKVLEEAPAPGMTAERRAMMGEAAVTAAKAVGYVGAGTVEFIVAQDGAAYFMEMNTRLQVEHPVTEMITGLDLVEWQLRIAAGEPLPLRQDEVRANGHAIEARIYAEDADNGFLPSTGQLVHFTTSAESGHVRIDSGVDEGDAITAYYDPMIAKLVVWDADRDAALARMRLALAQVHIVGPRTNVAFLSRLIATRSFATADLDTGLIEREAMALAPSVGKVSDEALLMALLAELLEEAEADDGSPWNSRDGWRLNGRAARTIAFQSGEATIAVTVTAQRRGWGLTVGGRTVAATVEPRPLTPPGRGGDSTGTATPASPLTGGERDRVRGPTHRTISASIGGKRLNARVVATGDIRHVFLAGEHFTLTRLPDLPRGEGGEASAGGLRAKMPGRIVALLAQPGAKAAKGAPLLVMEAMKMEHTLIAPADGTVTAYRCAVGEQVNEGAELIDFEAGA